MGLARRLLELALCCCLITAVCAAVGDEDGGAGPAAGAFATAGAAAAVAAVAAKVASKRKRKTVPLNDEARRAKILELAAQKGLQRCYDITCKGSCGRTMLFDAFPGAQVGTAANKPGPTYVATENLTIGMIQNSKRTCSDCMPAKLKANYAARKAAHPDLLKCEHLIKSAVTRARLAGREFSITIALVLAMIVAQEYVCDLCGVTTVLNLGVSFMASIDRLTNHLGYIVGNFRIVCSELNVSSPVPPTRQDVLGIFDHFAGWIIGQYDKTNPKYLAWRAAVEANKPAMEAYVFGQGGQELKGRLANLVSCDTTRTHSSRLSVVSTGITGKQYIAKLVANEYTCTYTHAPLQPGMGNFLSASPERLDNAIDHTEPNTVPIALLLNSAASSTPGIRCWWPKKLVWVMLNSKYFTPTLTATEKRYLQVYHDSLPGPSF